MSDNRTPDVVEHASPLSFDATVERLVHVMTDRGMTIFARIDHAAHARDVGLTMRPATVLIYGSPKAGTPIMIATPMAALDLPLRILVQERDDGTVVIAFHPVKAMLGRAGVPEDVAGRLEPAQHALVAALAP